MLILLFLLSTSIFSQTNRVDSSIFLLEKEREYEKEMSEYIKRWILDRILGPDKASVIVDVKLGIEYRRKTAGVKESKTEGKPKALETEYLLPGVPLPRSFTSPLERPKKGKEDIASQELGETVSELVIKRQNITVIHDKKIPAARLMVASQTIITAYNLQLKGPKPRDTLTFQAATFTVPFFHQLLKSKFTIPLLLSTLLFLLLLSTLGSFLKRYLNILRERGATEVRVDSKLEGENLGGLGSGGGGGTLTRGEEEVSPEEEKKKEEEEEKFEPFSYINDENIKKLVYLVRNEDPRTIAIVLSYLKPEYVKEIVDALPPEIQTKVAISMSIVKQSSKEEIMELDASIKEKIDFLVGGPEELLRVMENVDEELQRNILEYLQDEKPELYEAVRSRIIFFEDIANFPDLAVQTIIREVGYQRLGNVLKYVPQEVVDKIFANISRGGAVFLKEEMEYGRPLSPEELSTEKKKIVDIIKKLEDEGKIHIREKGKKLEALDFEETSVGGGSSREFDQYYQSAIEIYNQGRYEEALPYFQYCIQINPNSAEAYKFLANIYYSLGQYPEALSAYEKALELDPSDDSLRSWVGELKKSLTV